MAVKQVIVVRKDLKMGKGKMASQVSHACMKVFFQCIRKNDKPANPCKPEEMQFANYFEFPALPYFDEYISGAFKKIVLYVENEAELLAKYREALDAGINCSLIRDAGLTAFNGVPTLTCAAIGPWDAKDIDNITGQLQLA